MTRPYHKISAKLPILLLTTLAGSLVGCTADKPEPSSFVETETRRDQGLANKTDQPVIELFGTGLGLMAPLETLGDTLPPSRFPSLEQELTPRPVVKPAVEIGTVPDKPTPLGPAAIDASMEPASPEFTLREAVIETMLRDPEIAIEESRFLQAAHDVDIASGALRPRVDLQASAGPRYGDSRDDPKTTTLSRDGSVSVRQKIYDGESTRNTITSREFQRDAASLAMRSKQESVSLDVALAYLGLLEADELYNLALENQKEHERILLLVTASVEQGFSTQADLSRVEARLAEARSLVFDQLSARDQASQQLEKLIGRKPEGLVPPSLPAMALPLDLEMALDDLVIANPDLARLDAERASAQRDLEALFGSFVPNVDVLVQGSMNNDTSGYTGTGGELKGLLTMNYNLYAGGADEARQRNLRERVREIDLEFRKELRDRKQSLSDQYTALSASRQKRDNLEEGVDASSSVSRLYLEQFKAGRRSVFELLDSQVDLYTAKRDRVQNLFEELKRSYQILSDLGRLQATIENS